MRTRLIDGYLINPDRNDAPLGVLTYATPSGPRCCYADGKTMTAVLMSIKARLGEWRNAKAELRLDGRGRLLSLSVDHHQAGWW